MGRGVDDADFLDASTEVDLPAEKTGRWVAGVDTDLPEVIDGAFD